MYTVPTNLVAKDGMAADVAPLPLLSEVLGCGDEGWRVCGVLWILARRVCAAQGQEGTPQARRRLQQAGRSCHPAGVLLGVRQGQAVRERLFSAVHGCCVVWLEMPPDANCTLLGTAKDPSTACRAGGKGTLVGKAHNFLF